MSAALPPAWQDEGYLEATWTNVAWTDPAGAPRTLVAVSLRGHVDPLTSEVVQLVVEVLVEYGAYLELATGFAQEQPAEDCESRACVPCAVGWCVPYEAVHR